MDVRLSGCLTSGGLGAKPPGRFFAFAGMSLPSKVLSRYHHGRDLILMNEIGANAYPDCMERY